MIAYTHRWQPRSATSVLTVSYAHVPLTFSKSIMVSISRGIKLGCRPISSIFVEPGAKINGQYYRDVLLMRDLLPAVPSIAGDESVLQQDDAPAHRARDTVELRRWTHASSSFMTTAAFFFSRRGSKRTQPICPANSPHLKPDLTLMQEQHSSTNQRYGQVATAACYPDMPIGKVWIYRLLFVCLYGYGFLSR